MDLHHLLLAGLPAHSALPPAKISAMAQLSHPARGAYRDRHGRWAWDAVAAAASGARKRADEWRHCGRQSRVVLTPRRWRQVRGELSRKRRWQESPVTGESTK